MNTTPGSLRLFALLLVPCLAACDAPPAPAPAGSGTAAAPARSGGIRVGAPAPDVTLPLHDGTSVKLGSLRGSQVLLYFYPKDDTPGCRIEAQGFRDSHGELTKAGVRVFGVSTQDAASHKAFIDKESLGFPLVVDGGGIAKAFGVPVRLGFAARQSFLIGADGNIKKVWRTVDPRGHAAEVLAASK